MLKMLVASKLQYNFFELIFFHDSSINLYGNFYVKNTTKYAKECDQNTLIGI